MGSRPLCRICITARSRAQLLPPPSAGAKDIYADSDFEGLEYRRNRALTGLDLWDRFDDSVFVKKKLSYQEDLDSDYGVSDYDRSYFCHFAALTPRTGKCSKSLP